MALAYKQALPIWWSFFWRAVVFGAVFGIFFGSVGGVWAGITGVPEKATAYGTIGGYIAGIPASLIAIKQALSKHVAFLASLRTSEA